MPKVIASQTQRLPAGRYLTIHRRLQPFAGMAKKIAYWTIDHDQFDHDSDFNLDGAEECQRPWLNGVHFESLTFALISPAATGKSYRLHQTPKAGKAE